jgi:dual specificity phosphatase 12
MVQLFDLHPGVVSICPGLFLGDEEAALDMRLHKKLQFALVINCSNHIPFVRYKDPRTRYVKVPVEDNLRVTEVNKLATLLPITIAKIHETLADGKTVLVHCRLGRQRSAAVVSAYLMYRDGITPIDAMHLVKVMKPDAFQPMPNFVNALDIYHTHLLGQGPSLDRVQNA